MLTTPKLILGAVVTLPLWVPSILAGLVLSPLALALFVAIAAPLHIVYFVSMLRQAAVPTVRALFEALCLPSHKKSTQLPDAERTQMYSAYSVIGLSPEERALVTSGRSVGGITLQHGIKRSDSVHDTHEETVIVYYP
ncbi:hypothetical protein RI367_004482 [Sorochytrium milnesiophthora]